MLWNDFATFNSIHVLSTERYTHVQKSAKRGAIQDRDIYCTYVGITPFKLFTKLVQDNHHADS